MFLRRLILVTLVLVALSWVLQGCATVDVQCDMRADYRRPAAVPSHGSTAFTWAFGQSFPDLRYGQTTCLPDGCIVSLRAFPHVNDPCSLAQFGHEVLEVIAKGKAHE